MKQGLGVAPAFEVMTFSDESLAELAEVIDLSVEHNPEIPVLVGHRLGCGRRQIDDPETVMAKGYRTLLNVGAAIGPSVVLDGNHAEKCRRIGGPSAKPYHSRDTAHHGLQDLARRYATPASCFAKRHGRAIGIA